MENLIVVVGSPEFTFGFEIAGLKAFLPEDFSKAISKEEDNGIVILDEIVYNTLSQREKQQINTMTKPLVVILSQDDAKGSNLREMIIKALGVDLLKDK
ncbi:MAG: hypothetical protein LAT82_02555 [Nanoarchaeota archaeon]|nr:hypothetical protein [Nanoarchaeota archaeon]